MPWTIKPSLESATDGGDSVGTVSGTYTDGDLFVEPFTCSLRDKVAGDFSSISKLFNEQLEAERNRRAVQRKLATVIESELNK